MKMLDILALTSKSKDKQKKPTKIHQEGKKNPQKEFGLVVLAV